VHGKGSGEYTGWKYSVLIKSPVQEIKAMKIEKKYTRSSLFALLFLIPVLAHSEPSDSKLNLQFGYFAHFFKLSNEMAYRLEWGKDTIRNISVLTFDTTDIINCRLVTESDEFIVLKIDGDTGTRKSIILPLNMKSREIEYKNAICIDLENQTIIIEYPSQDSVLIVENFINKKKMMLGKNFIPCKTGFAHDCLDSLIFYGNKLSFKWVTPDKYTVDKKVGLKRFKINLR
jgi:hypothetical protein